MASGTMLTFLTINKLALATFIFLALRLYIATDVWNQSRKYPTVQPARSKKYSTVQSDIIEVYSPEPPNHQNYPTDQPVNKKTNCLTFPSGDWQDSGHPEYKYWVYSAYDFGDSQVVMVGSPYPFTEEEYNQPLVRCVFHWINDANQSTPGCTTSALFISRATISRMERYKHDWAATLVHCPAPNYKQYQNNRPAFVSLLLPNQGHSPVRLPIQYRNLSDSFSRPYTFSVCVLPLYDYDDPFHFLEWLEFYKMMGVEHFTFYNRSIGPKTSCVLNNLEKYYENEIRLDVHPWRDYKILINGSKIKFRTDRTELSAGANECLLRHKGVSDYVIFVDVDEFITPREGIPDYFHLLEYLYSTRARGSKIGAYVFQNTFHLRSRKVDPDISKRCSGLRGNPVEYFVCQQMWIMKYAEGGPAWWHGVRSKYIYSPDAVKNAGIHRVLDFWDDSWTSNRVEENVATSRHYRILNITENSTMARMPLGVGTQLAVNLAASFNYLRDACGLLLADMYE